MIIHVCIGSACHVRGSYGILNAMKQLVEENQVGDRVKVVVAFCLGKCAEGVTIKVDDEIITGLTLDNVNDVFRKHVLEPLGA